MADAADDDMSGGGGGGGGSDKALVHVAAAAPAGKARRAGGPSAPAGTPGAAGGRGGPAGDHLPQSAGSSGGGALPPVGLPPGGGAEDVRALHEAFLSSARDFSAATHAAAHAVPGLQELLSLGPAGLGDRVEALHMGAARLAAVEAEVMGLLHRQQK
jgi:hypothetical protein